MDLIANDMDLIEGFDEEYDDDDTDYDDFFLYFGHGVLFICRDGQGTPYKPGLDQGQHGKQPRVIVIHEIVIKKPGLMI